MLLVNHMDGKKIIKMKKANKIPNIEKTVESGLCTSCEVCNAACSVGAIKVRYQGGQFLPQINKDKCTKCGLCLRVCPGISIEENILKKDDDFKKEITGNFLEDYSAYSKDITILNNFASGGLITTLAINLLKDG